MNIFGIVQHFVFLKKATLTGAKFLRKTSSNTQLLTPQTKKEWTK